jgi:hypothetical protein
MAATDDLVFQVLDEIEQRITAYTTTLVSSEVNRHDRLCGTITGLREAKNLLDAMARKFRLNDFDPEDEPALPFATKQRVRA